MNPQIHTDNEELFLEITRYLAAVDLYRTEQCEPTWRPEWEPYVTSHDRPLVMAKPASSAH